MLNFNIFFNKQMYVVPYHCIFGVFGLLEPKFELELENKLLRYCSHCFSCKILANFVENSAHEIKTKNAIFILPKIYYIQIKQAFLQQQTKT